MGKPRRGAGEGPTPLGEPLRGKKKADNEKFGVRQEIHQRTDREQTKEFRGGRQAILGLRGLGARVLGTLKIKTKALEDCSFLSPRPLQGTHDHYNQKKAKGKEERWCYPLRDLK